MNEDEIFARSISIRPRAVKDIEQHADYLEENATSDVAQRFRIAIMDAIAQIGSMPGAGAPRPILSVALSGLRMWVVSEFRNYLIFYLTPENKIEIVRVLHGAQNTNYILENEE